MSQNGDLLSGKIQFVQHFLPGLEAGSYELALSQKVAGGKAIPEQTLESSYKFAVLGERFSLKSDEVVALFPPPSQGRGYWDNTLPHMVFKRRTLPWERTLTPGQFPPPPDGGTDKDFPSWMALLVFYESDFKGEARKRLQTGKFVQSGTVADLLPKTVDCCGWGRSPGSSGPDVEPKTCSEGQPWHCGKLPDGYLCYPHLLIGKSGKLDLEYGETVGDVLRYIDVPGDLFTRIAPKKSELKLLAHARRVDQTKKSDRLLEGEPSKDYSVLVSNRLPARGTTAHVQLVSLEGMGDYLPDGASPPQKGQTVRLVSLHHWRFTSYERQETFEQFILALDPKGKKGSRGSLSLPPPPKLEITSEEEGTAGAAIADAFEWGFVPLAHQTRNGQDIVSWYRGPLVPVMTTLVEELPRHHADALLRYNPQTGMFDVSYAAAWEIGRLLALHQKKYAKELYLWKKGQKQKAVHAEEWKLLGEKWGSLIPAGPRSTADFHRLVFLGLMESHLRHLDDEKKVESIRKKRERR